MSKSYKTTKKHFKLFKKECRYWLDKFDLGSWGIDYSQTNSPEFPEVRGYITVLWKDRVATISLAIDWGEDKPTQKKVAETSFHEACELLLWMVRVYGVTNASPSQIDEVNSYNHATIRRLEKAIWEPYWEEK